MSDPQKQSAPEITRLFGAKDPRSGRWLRRKRFGVEEPMWTISAAVMEAEVRDALRLKGTPPRLWAEFYSIVEVDMAEACRISEIVRAGGCA